MIPVNTRFDTILSTKIEKTPDPMISSETIHGEWLLRLEKRGEDIETIKSRIKADLSARGVNSNDAGEYPIGTIAPIDFENTCFFLLAISRFDTHNRALSNKEFIQTSVKELMEFYDINGQGYEMFMPLLGTGRSRANISFKESYDIIKDTALNSKNAYLGKITIVVTKKAMKELINWR